MKICLCHNLYGKFSHGGAEMMVDIMATDLKKSGHEVFLITTSPEGDKESSGDMLNSDLKTYHLKSNLYYLQRFNIFIRFAWHVNNLLDFNKYRKIKNILKKERPDLVITHNLIGLGFLTPVAIRSLNIEHHHFLHDIQLLHPSGLMFFGRENILNSLSAKIYQFITKVLLASPHKIVSPSKWLLDLHLKKGFFKKSTTEVKPFTSSLGEKKIVINKKMVNFLFVGQLEEQKGIILLLKAFKKINNPEIRLVIASRNGGQLISEIKKICALDKRITILSPLTFLETKNLMLSSDCLIVPSLCYENSPTVIYGAHSAGLKIIAANIGGIPEICDKGDLIFSPGSEDDLIKKILLTI